MLNIQLKSQFRIVISQLQSQKAVRYIRLTNFHYVHYYFQYISSFYSQKNLYKDDVILQSRFYCNCQKAVADPREAPVTRAPSPLGPICFISCTFQQTFCQTRMHSSRMRTVRNSSRLLGGVAYSWGGACSRGG